MMQIPRIVEAVDEEAVDPMAAQCQELLLKVQESVNEVIVHT